MSYSLRLQAIAEKEMHQAYTWYEDQRTGIGDDFLLCTEAVFEAICDNPLHFPIVQKQIQRAVIRRFPYAVFFIVGDEYISVLAVLHCKRRPHRFYKN